MKLHGTPLFFLVHIVIIRIIFFSYILEIAEDINKLFFFY